MDELEFGAPYDGKGNSLRVTKKMHYPQLADEIVKVLPDGISFVAQGDIIGDGEVVLHFSDPTVDLAAVGRVVDQHEVDYNHGLTEDQISLNSLRARLAKGDLAVKDLNALLRLHFKDDAEDE